MCKIISMTSCKKKSGRAMNHTNRKYINIMIEVSNSEGKSREGLLYYCQSLK